MSAPATATASTHALTQADYGCLLVYVLPDWTATERGITEEVAQAFFMIRRDPSEADELRRAIDDWRFARADKGCVQRIVERQDLLVCDGCDYLRPCQPFPDSCDALCEDCTETRLGPAHPNPDEDYEFSRDEEVAGA